MNIMNKIKEAFNERNKSGTTLLLFGAGAFMYIGTLFYGMASTPNLKVAREFDYCGKKAKIIVEERKLTFNGGYVLLNDRDVVRGTFISDDGDTIKTNIDGYVINNDSTKW
ncbi:hypothetical protein HY212_01925 [Candidatus Pacearchaeota archaeon]|nr:hypothetical protein [Candidatus Pacearchaeota archaeon]